MTAASRVLRHTWATWTTVARVPSLALLLVLTVGVLPAVQQPSFVRNAPPWMIAIGLLFPVTALLQVQLPVDTLPVRRVEADRGELLAFALPSWALVALASPWLTLHTSLVCALAVASWVAPLLGGRTATALLPAAIGAVGTAWSHRPVAGLTCTVLLGLVHAAWWSSTSTREALDERPAPLDAPPRGEESLGSDLADWLGLRSGTVPHGPREVLVEMARRLPLRLLGLAALGLVFVAIGWLFPGESNPRDLGLNTMASLWLLFGGSTFAGAGRRTTAPVVHLPIAQRMLLVDGLMRAGGVAIGGVAICLVVRDPTAVIAAGVLFVMWIHGAFTDHAPHSPSLKGLQLTARSVALALATPVALYATLFAARPLDLPFWVELLVPLILLGTAWLLAIAWPVWRATPT